MRVAYNLELCRELEQMIAASPVEVAYRPERYDRDQQLRVAISTVYPAFSGWAGLRIDKFLGGGFAGQVYRCVLTELELPAAAADTTGLQLNQLYAVKIIIPPSGFARWFRNTVYWLGFQGPFSSQVNLDACRAGLLWQKVLRRAGTIAFGRDDAVKDAYASFWDPRLQAFGEITEWVEGRTWRLEADADLQQRRAWQTMSPQASASAEYIAKRQFMRRMVELCHSIGAVEFARQYEWWTMKSQPNVLKRDGNAADPGAGLCAIDFRAGLALLPFLPMSPADFKLIVNGLLQRRTLVQFDRTEPARLDTFVQAHAECFADMLPLISELKQRDQAYRQSLPDITHHRSRLLTDAKLRRSVRRGLIEGYEAADLADAVGGERLRQCNWLFALFYVLGALPLFGRLLRRLLAHRQYRHHYRRLLTECRYFYQAWQHRAWQRLLRWHRSGRSGEAHCRFLAQHPTLCWLERLTVGWLPAPLHRYLVEPQHLWQQIRGGWNFIRSFYDNAAFRENWLVQLVRAGEHDGVLAPDDRDRILQHVSDPYIARYLKCVAVHFATIPVTQVVSVTVAATVMTWLIITGRADWNRAAAYAGLIVAFFQVTPISPGSICRGCYVLYLMARERNLRDYLIAAPLSFVKYIGYLAFPLQMATTYPQLARFMASRWATNAVHIVPVFGEKGALLEHYIFDLVFNLPLKFGRWASGRVALLLTIWLLFGTGLAAAAYAWVRPEPLSHFSINLMLALLAVFVLPRMLFYPLLMRKPRLAPPLATDVEPES